ncbi:esterase/lipase family protein [Noviherbaspirillum saxi]|uniref:esterase/lipase family protein n=1 Tax=Noviherbaspirillum saxi TaxID=2320863 RepID=UPI003083CFE0
MVVQFIAGIAIYAALIRWWPQLGIPGAITFSVSTIVLVRMAITANNFVLASRTRSKLPAHYEIGTRELLRLFLHEFAATMFTSSWTMAFRAFSRRVPERPQGLPVLLIHGYGCNSGYWDSMSKALLKTGITHHAIDLEPVIGSIDAYTKQIHEAVEALCRETGHGKLIVVAHSMGGLATRAYLRGHGSARIAKAITLGTPHRGTALAHFGVGINTHQMRWTAVEEEGIASDWLLQLAAEESKDTYRLFVSIYSHHDNIISPQTSSWLDGAKNIEFHAIGHVALGLHPLIQAEVIQQVRAVSREVEASSGKRVLA